MFPPPPPPFSSQPPPRFPPTTPQSPGTPSPQQSRSQIKSGYQLRAIEVPAVEEWTPDVDYHDTTKVGGIDLPKTIRSSRFADSRDITGMDPPQVPLWKLLYNGLHSAWLRKMAHGREVFVVPIDTIGMTVFFAELSHQLKARNIDIDRLSTYRSRQAGTNLATKEATQTLAREVAQHLQSLLPSYQTPDTSSQQRILELEAELAKVKGTTHTEDKDDKPTPTASGTKPIQEALQGRPPSTPAFDPSSLLVAPGAPSHLLTYNPPESLSDANYKKWFKGLQLTPVQIETLNKNIDKTMAWWKEQPEEAIKTIHRVAVGMGIDATKIKPGTVHEVILKIMTIATTCAS